jgi:hypothetical protein
MPIVLLEARELGLTAYALRLLKLLNLGLWLGVNFVRQRSESVRLAFVEEASLLEEKRRIDRTINLRIFPSERRG